MIQVQRSELEALRDVLKKTMGAFGGTCAWHNDVEKAIADLESRLAETGEDEKPECFKVIYENGGYLHSVYMGGPEESLISFFRARDIFVDSITPLYTHPAHRISPCPDGYVCVPKEYELGGWIWGWLMDYCRKRGIAPANMDSLFKLVDDYRAMLDTYQQPPEGETP